MNKALKFLTFFGLIGALLYGWNSQENKTAQYLSSNFDGYSIEKAGSEPEVYQVLKGEDIVYYIYPGLIMGWGGPMIVAPVVSPDGVIEEVLVPKHRETKAFFDYVVSSGFLSQFKGKSPGTPMEFGEDIDGVSGATVSSLAISNGVCQGMATVSQELLKKPREEVAVSWKIGRNEVILLLLYAVVLICSQLKIKKAKLPILVASFIFLGLIMNRPVSISNMAALAMGHLPDIHSSLFWWMLVPGSIVLVIASGKNLYCSRLCPFGAIQEFITITGGMKLFVSKKSQNRLRTAAKAMAWFTLIIAFITGNAANASTEPFGTLFGLIGTPFQWYLVSIAIGGSFLIPKFWCRFFCPAGVCYHKLSGIRRVVAKGISIQPSMKKERHETLGN